MTGWGDVDSTQTTNTTSQPVNHSLLNGEEQVNETCETGKIFCNDICVLSHCIEDKDCDDFNPYTKDICVDKNTCSAKCIFTTDYKENEVQNIVNATVKKDNLTISQNVKYYNDDKTNKTFVTGSFAVEKKTSNEYILFIINDPRGFITSRIDKAHFSIAPWKVTDSQLIWKLNSNESIMLIRYWFDEELSETIVKNNVKIEESTKVRKATVTEKAYSQVSNKSDIYFSDTINKLIITLFVVIVVVVVGFSIYFIQQRKERQNLIKEIK
jgi:hypothetical protein